MDRLGRNYEDVTEVIRQFIGNGVTVRTVINGMVFDGNTKDPVQQAVCDALIGFLAATAQAQAEATKIAQRAGIDAVKDDPLKYRGRKPSFDREAVGRIRDLFNNGVGPSAVAKETGLSRQAVFRVSDDRECVDAALRRWGM